MGGSKYPYFYMDIEKYGFIRVLLNNVVVYVVFVAFGYLIQFLDNKLALKK